ncbi:FAD-binding monooxygenase [Kitasatospora sp. MMS16-BH015]|uniref:FAD-dependent oxidoreductase n=1 Tax=Kitasatospora sp. MMS16-BH015 TaxID=2018025 RepID=UPI000CA0B46E|nr:FAD-dependent monooxygenase [Kitasatospora sp. MMS16-BH015]AUG80610.1 FAD-binding monooxygenase [Kitasatospora sp. MMS16-BH015]
MVDQGTVSGRGTAVVIGGGHAGLLAAWALRGYADEVVVVERDRYPAETDFRAGVPQGRHAHLLLEAGHRALEEQMPGIRAELVAAGAVWIHMAEELRWLSPAGWMAKHESDLRLLSGTRPVLERAVLERVRTEPSIRIEEGTEVVGLLGSPGTVTGVRVRERGEGGEVREIPAELVVDASGRSTSVPGWLAELGVPPVPEERVDPGVKYASRLYQRPAGAEFDFEALYVQAKAPDVPQVGVLLPVENDRWIVSLGGMRGGHPEAGEAGFLRHLDLLRDSPMREAVLAATPVTEVRGFLPGPGVFRHYERSAPDGLVVLGDASCTFNPVYGQGLTVAAFGAGALRAAVAQYGGISHPAARAARKAVALVSKEPWVMSSGEDVRFAATTGGPSGVLVKVQHRFLDRVLQRATKDPHIAAVFYEVMSLVTPSQVLFRPANLASVLRG